MASPNQETTIQMSSISQPNSGVTCCPNPQSQQQPQVEGLMDIADAGTEMTMFVGSTPRPTWDAAKAKDLPRNAYLQQQLKSGFSVATFEFNDPSTLTAYFITSAITKAHASIWKRFIAGLLAGVFVCFGAMFAISAAGGLDSEFRERYPGIPKLIIGFTFPVAITMILIVGGDLFAGNCFFAGMALFTGRMGIGEFTNLLFVSFFSNLSGLLFCDYFLGYQSDLFAAEPWNSFVLTTANHKVALSFGACILRAIGANALICIAIFMGSASREALGRFIIIFGPVSAFVVTGFEHVIPNMAFIPIALMYGGTTFSTSEYIYRSMIPSAIGNLIGGTFLVGGFLAYLYAKRRQDTFMEWLRYICIPDVPLRVWFTELWDQMFADRPIKDERKQT